MSNKIQKVKINLNKKWKKNLKQGIAGDKNQKIILGALIVIASFLLGVNYSKILSLRESAIRAQKQEAKTSQVQKPDNLTVLQDKVIKKNPVFKIKWGALGKKMVEDGVIDEVKFAKAVTGKEQLPPSLKKYLVDGQNQIELNGKNSQFWADLLWGIGLANKSIILETGPMVEGNQTANFASTGGWTIGAKQPMQIYSKYNYIPLSEEQQQRIKELAANIYRPCCDNPTAFPDCNHGLAALGLIELMVSQNFSDEEIYETVLVFNTYWFPQTYLNAAYYLQQNGRDYDKVPAKEILSKTFSSASGSQAISQKVGNLKWPAFERGGLCAP